MRGGSIQPPTPIKNNTPLKLRLSLFSLSCPREYLSAKENARVWPNIRCFIPICRISFPMKVISLIASTGPGGRIISYYFITVHFLYISTELTVLFLSITLIQSCPFRFFSCKHGLFLIMVIGLKITFLIGFCFLDKEGLFTRFQE